MPEFPLELNFNSLQISQEQFYQICQDNQELRFEKNTQGAIIIMTPAGDESSYRNGRLTQQLFNWSDQDKTGIPFDSSAGFVLPNGATRSPDGAWIPLAKWLEIPVAERERFAPICPDFVIELRSSSDRLKPLQDKMTEYIENGTRLGWLINRQARQVEIYRPCRAVEILDNPATLSGEDILVGFTLDLTLIW
jgi:Uma2 family endonuclease